MQKKPGRKVYCKDSLIWLKGKNFKAIITSLPDMIEVALSLKNYLSWLEKAAFALSAAVDENGCIIFYQTNRKLNGIILDKEYLISDIFYKEGYNKIAQKIILRKKPGSIDLYRPSFSTMFCFSKKLSSGSVVADVMYTGKMIKPNSIGLTACEFALDFMERQVNTDIIVDPFCGAGTVLAMANFRGLHAIGVDIDSKQVAAARKLSLINIMHSKLTDQKD